MCCHVEQILFSISEYLLDLLDRLIKGITHYTLTGLYKHKYIYLVSFYLETTEYL